MNCKELNVFEALGISQGDSIDVYMPMRDTPERSITPLSFTKYGNIRAIDHLHGTIFYVNIETDEVETEYGLLPFECMEAFRNIIEQRKIAKEAQKEAKKQAEAIDKEYQCLQFKEFIQACSIKGHVICVTGTIPNISRKEATEMLIELGADVVKAPTKKTTLLIQGDTGRYNVTSKMKKAQENKTKIILIS